MTEQEIINYLKDNRNRGVTFGFMPEEVKAWCGFNSPNKIFRVYNGIWSEPGNINCFNAGYAYALFEDYEQEPEFEPHWEEFDIDKNGFFVVKPVNPDDSPKVYHWWQWTKFLSDNYVRYNDFGGWVYEVTPSDGEKIEVLTTSPHVFERGKDLSAFIILNGKNESKPAYPTKIFFWRYRE